MQLKCGERRCHAMIVWPHNIIIFSRVDGQQGRFE